MALSGKFFMHPWEGYFDVYFPSFEANPPVSA